MPSRLDQPGDPYRCCVPGCTRRSRGHLCARCYATYVDPDTHALPAWLVALRREATRLTMREHRGWQHYGVVVYDEGSGDIAKAMDPTSVDWEDESLVLVTIAACLVVRWLPCTVVLAALRDLAAALRPAYEDDLRLLVTLTSA